MSRPLWTPDHPVDAALAAHLIGRQFPEFSGQTPQDVGRGFDADVWRVGDFAFRFPRRHIAVDCIAAEMRVLPQLASRLPLPVPEPLYFGQPTPEFPAPFYGHRFVAGVTGDRAALDASARGAMAPQLGAFLCTLHAISPQEAMAFGIQPDAFRFDNVRRAERVSAQLGALEGSPWTAELPALRGQLAAPPPVGTLPPVPLHGDLYSRHLLFDGSRSLCGVIDWGDVCLGDPAIDLAVAFTFLPPEAREAFFAAYGPVDAATQARARFIGLAKYGVMMLVYARDVGDDSLAQEAGLGLLNALA